MLGLLPLSQGGLYVDGIENLEEEILASKFADVWKILLALKSQDDSLMETIDRLRIQIGRGSGTSRGGDGLEKIVIIPEKISNKTHHKDLSDYLARKLPLIKLKEIDDAILDTVYQFRSRRIYNVNTE